MKIVIDNEILLRSTAQADAKNIFEAFSTQGQYLRQWLPVAADFTSIVDVEMFIESAPFDRCNLFTIIYKNEYAGSICLSNISMTCKRAEIGYWLTKPMQGNGIMIRSVEALVKYAFEKFNRLSIKCAVENVRSKKIPKKLGFTFEGIERDGEISAYGYYNDLEIYSLLKRDNLNSFCKTIKFT